MVSSNMLGQLPFIKCQAEFSFPCGGPSLSMFFVRMKRYRSEGFPVFPAIFFTFWREVVSRAKNGSTCEGQQAGNPSLLQCSARGPDAPLIRVASVFIAQM